MRYSHIPMLLAVLLCVLFSATPARADFSLAVVDVQKLLSDSEAAKSIQKQMQKHREAFVEDLSKQEQELRKTEKTLTEERASLSQEEFAQKKKAFEEKFLEVRGKAQKQKSNLDEAAVQAMHKLRDQLYTVVQEIADENGYTLVISRQNVVVGEKSIDITAETMKRLNKSLSEIALEIKSK